MLSVTLFRSTINSKEFLRDLRPRHFRRSGDFSCCWRFQQERGQTNPEQSDLMRGDGVIKRQRRISWSLLDVTLFAVILIYRQVLPISVEAENRPADGSAKIRDC